MPFNVVLVNKKIVQKQPFYVFAIDQFYNSFPIKELKNIYILVTVFFWEYITQGKFGRIQVNVKEKKKVLCR